MTRIAGRSFELAALAKGGGPAGSEEGDGDGVTDRRWAARRGRPRQGGDRGGLAAPESAGDEAGR